MISLVIKWANGMVMVFDLQGKQMPEYQGPLDEVRDKILRDAPPTTRFEACDWMSGESKIINRDSL